MIERTIKIPGPDHPITIERNGRRVIVTVGGRAIADCVCRTATRPPAETWLAMLIWPTNARLAEPSTLLPIKNWALPFMGWSQVA
jgi:hypothetical protein